MESLYFLRCHFYLAGVFSAFHEPYTHDVGMDGPSVGFVTVVISDHWQVNTLQLFGRFVIWVDSVSPPTDFAPLVPKRVV